VNVRDIYFARRAVILIRNAEKEAAMKRYALPIIFFLLTANAALAQTKTPVEGVWKIAERIVPGTNPRAKGVTITYKDPPSLIIFTRGYYSQVYLGEEEPRAAIPRAKDPQNLTDAEKIARYEQWRPLFANAGTYEIKGSTLTVHPIVAKNPNQMNGSHAVEFKLEGPNKLWLIPTAEESAIEPRIKLTRVE
jgi:hypothetical protein